jgi:hypothetical protein
MIPNIQLANQIDFEVENTMSQKVTIKDYWKKTGLLKDNEQTFEIPGEQVESHIVDHGELTSVLFKRGKDNKYEFGMYINYVDGTIIVHDLKAPAKRKELFNINLQEEIIITNDGDASDIVLGGVSIRDFASDIMNRHFSGPIEFESIQTLLHFLSHGKREPVLPLLEREEVETDNFKMGYSRVTMPGSIIRFDKSISKELRRQYYAIGKSDFHVDLETGFINETRFRFQEPYMISDWTDERVNLELTDKKKNTKYEIIGIAGQRSNTLTRLIRTDKSGKKRYFEISKQQRTLEQGVSIGYLAWNFVETDEHGKELNLKIAPMDYVFAPERLVSVIQADLDKLPYELTHKFELDNTKLRSSKFIDEYLKKRFIIDLERIIN